MNTEQTSKNIFMYKDNCLELELMANQPTTAVRELEEHEPRNVADAPGEERSDETALLPT